MPTKVINGVTLYYEVYGPGPETIFLAHGLLWNCSLFYNQVDELKDKYRCVIFDLRGQGQSAITDDGYDMDSLTEDVFQLIKSFDCASCHFVGQSMGGFIGMRLAIKYPELIKSLILIGTSADPEPVENVGRYKRLNFIARWLGFRIIANQVMPIMFGQKFLQDTQRRKLKEKWREVLISNHRVGIAHAVNGVINRQGIRDQLSKIAAPTLIMVGDQDVATVLHKSERMHARISGSQLLVIPGAGHTATVEEPLAVNSALQKFYNGLL